MIGRPGPAGKVRPFVAGKSTDFSAARRVWLYVRVGASIDPPPREDKDVKSVDPPRYSP